VQGGRRLPDSTPYSGLVAVETNDEGWVKFIKNVNDPGAYKRRMTVIRQPYLRSISRERRLYEKALAQIPAAERAEFDPFVLESMALLAVWSRQKNPDRLTVPYRGMEVTLDLDDRMHILDGDLLRLQLAFDKYRSEGFGPKREQYSSGSDPGERVAQMLKAFRDASDCMEGFGGLSVAFMKELVVIPLARDGRGYPGGRVTFLNAVAYLTRIIKEQMTTKDVDADPDQSRMYKACIEQLDVDSVVARLVESSYRRRLVQAMELAFFPELEELRHAQFVDYFNLATAISSGEPRFRNHAGRECEANRDAIAALLKPVEDRIAGISDDKAARDFRSRIKARCQQYLRAEAQRREIDESLLEPSWDTVPEIAKAIVEILARKHLNEVQACLDEHYDPGKEGTARDTGADAKMRAEALSRLQATGYSDDSLQAMLRYFRANKLWAFVSTL
jgi:predicted Ser/Thr protein kinase